MAIIKQDPGFFLNYVIVHCNFSCSVGATHRQELKQSANYKRWGKSSSPQPSIFSFHGLFPHNCGTFLLTDSLQTSSMGWVEVDGEVPGGCRAVSKAGAVALLLAAPFTDRRREGRGWKARIWPSILVLPHQDPPLHITPRKYSTTLSFPPSYFIFFKS